MKILCILKVLTNVIHFNASTLTSLSKPIHFFFTHLQLTSVPIGNG